MRRRLLTLVFATTLFALTFLGVVLVTVIWGFMGSTSQDRATQTARIAASALEDSIEAGGPVSDATLTGLVRDEAFLTAVLPDGRTLVSGPAPIGEVYSATEKAGEVSVTAEIPMSVNVDKIRFQGGIIVALSVVALAISMLVALFYARRITRPLEDLAELAGRMATGDRRQINRRYGVPEIDAVADVLDEAVTSFNDLLENERRVTTEASHQLRTPLTALSLRLEEILATDDIEVVHAEAIVDDLVKSQIVEWSPAFEVEGRSLQLEGVRGLVVVAGRGAQSQALATLVENSLVHGRGTTSVRVRESASWVVVEVSDEGEGVPAGLEQRVFERNVSGAQSSGLGLALARTLVMADGGRLEMLSARPAVFAMFLPAHAEEPAAQEPAQETWAGEKPVADRSGDSAPDAVALDDASLEDQVTVEMVSSTAASTSSGNTHRR
jgi:signal transduction histidine kinase